ncbi:MAG: LEPR-XLL domain-containing protein [Pseudomonadota bacterium]
MVNNCKPTSLIVEELEPRILFSADLSPLAVDVGYVASISSNAVSFSQPQSIVSAVQSQSTNVTASSSQIEQSHEIVFIDSAVVLFQDTTALHVKLARKIRQLDQFK